MLKWCNVCGPQVLLVYLSDEPIQLWTALEPCLEISLGVLREKQEEERRELYSSVKTVKINNHKMIGLFYFKVACNH